MLAPLKDRTILEIEDRLAVEEISAQTAGLEIEDLRRALRESRQRLRRGAWESTRQISQLNAEVSRLQILCNTYQSRLKRYQTGVAMIELGQALMRLAEKNEHLHESAQRACLLEKTLAASQEECRKLAQERDRLEEALRQIAVPGIAVQSSGG